MPFLNDMLDDIKTQNSQGDKITRKEEQSVKDASDLVTRFRFDVNSIASILYRNIIGQDSAIAAIEDALKVVRADISDPDRPLFVCLFLGPTGVGKTESVRLLAEAMHGDRNALCRVDMNTLSQEHYAAALTGAPPGYVGSREGSTVLDEEKIKGTFSLPGIVLFDEVEKASHEVVQTLLNVFDTGLMTVASGDKTIDFRNSMIFMTSNIAARDIQRQAGFAPALKARLTPFTNRATALANIVERRVVHHFEPEFINRIDNITTFSWIDGDRVRDLVGVEIEKLNQRIQKHRVYIVVNNEDKNFLARVGFDRKYGARTLKRAIRRYLEVPLAEFLIERGSASKDSEPVAYLARFNDYGKVTFDICDPQDQFLAS